jgi:hypothetical protein
LDLWFWWFMPFPEKIIARMLLHLKNVEDLNFILINVLESVHLNDLKAIGVVGIIVGIVVIGVSVVYHKYSRID